MLRQAQAADQPDGREVVFSGEGQLWAVLDGEKPIAAAITQIHGDRLLLWQIAGHRLSEWRVLFVWRVASWARAMGCKALYGAGRRGWKRVVEPLGFKRIADIDGRPSWQLDLEGESHA